MGDACNPIGEVDLDVHSRYGIQKRIGKGAYGIVWQAVSRQSGQTVAVKKIFDAFRNKTDAQRTYREVMFLRRFGHHPNIVQLYGVMRAENDLDLYLILEYMDIDLHHVIKRGNLLKDIHICYVMYQLLRALTCLHVANVIHRDLKPSNILLDANCRVRVADFGLARSLTSHPHDVQDDGDVDPTLTEYVATRWYRAPEILLADKMYTAGVDMWSAGCILGEMLLGKPLFAGMSTFNQIERIMAAVRPPTSHDIRNMCSGYALTVLERVRNKPKRSLRDMLPMATEDALDLVSKLVVFSPTKRLSAEQAIQHSYFKRFHNLQLQQTWTTEPTPPRFQEESQLTVADYRQKIYQLIEDCYSSPETGPSGLEDPLPHRTHVQNASDAEQESASSSSDESAGQQEGVASSKRDKPGVESPSQCRSNEDHHQQRPFPSPTGPTSLTNTTKAEFIPNTSHGVTLRKSYSQECVRSHSPVKNNVATSSLSLSRQCLTTVGSVLPAGLPSHHPRANTASAWLRYHRAVLPAQPTDGPPPPSSSSPNHRRIAVPPKERIRSCYGRRQFGNHANVSSMGSPKTFLHNYTQSHGTIAASALKQLRIAK